jgi:UDP-N-acetylglucosamine 2-epimerase (non-hydrolysing)
LLQEGIRAETVIKTGSSMKEVLEYYKNDIEKSEILSKLELHPSEYFVVSAHREENIDSDRNFQNFIETVNAIAEKYNKRMIVSTHPRTMKKVLAITLKQDKTGISPLIEWVKPVGFFDYIKLQMNAFCVISDSGTIMEEASLLSFPAITIRNAHERPEGMEEGVLILSGLKADRVLQSIDIVTSHIGHEYAGSGLVTDYNVLNLSDKVVKIIISYTDYVMRTVWREGDL